MEAMGPVMYWIDSTDQLTHVNAAWSAFADANEGRAVHPDQVIGRSLWDFLTDRTTKQLYQDMVRRVRRGGLPIRFQFRCDAPACKRLLAMEIARDGIDGVQFKVNRILEEQRPSVLPPARFANAPKAPRLTHGMCPMCFAALVGILDDPLLGASGAVALGDAHVA